MVVVGIASALVVASRSTAGSNPSPTATPSAAGPTMRTFHSTDLTVPAVSTVKTGTTAAGLVFVTQQVSGFNGLIMDDDGEPVWIEPTKANVTDLRVQSFGGASVLTYWTGKSTGGHGAGTGVILDTSYAQVATVSAGGGLDADLHEFNLTDRGTALITVYETIPADLSSIGGPKQGFMYDCRAQEIDVATGAVLLDWKASDHIPVSETYLGLSQNAGHDGTTAGRAFDPYHRRHDRRPEGGRPGDALRVRDVAARAGGGHGGRAGPGCRRHGARDVEDRQCVIGAVPPERHDPAFSRPSR